MYLLFSALSSDHANPGVDCQRLCEVVEVQRPDPHREAHDGGVVMCWLRVDTGGVVVLHKEVVVQAHGVAPPLVLF